ncbi:chemotaxis protein MotB [Defluviimonas sp. 20V17]|uniref:Chemotaxis MotB protein n=1 Tax=Allgaiera indica TaxID=765699 RepID=A0AAN4ZZG4_9RHOB|nr:flagellar motor protein MotB [Allgaiera indica]KDB02664.1 chemotaxis protein MotB [Defluviimonas sp. 20V17]GHE01832.1 chemotaxis MotB protein [Allgaiera indica]SDW92312.1 chemotaxis protein MotB [Allgaiera indica]
MDAHGNAAPVVIKRKKKAGADGHHGGAWKVAYADFVTAMMAFFMLMWLLNATTEKQRKGIADYFSPTIPINRVSGGGDGAFGGETVFSENQIAQAGTGASNTHPTEQRQASGAASPSSADGQAGRKEEQRLRALEQTLHALGGETMSDDNAMRHVVTKLTDEGLIVELFDLPKQPLFGADSAVPEKATRDLVKMIAEVFSLVGNKVAVAGHVRSYPVVLKDNPVWPLSVARAGAVRDLLEANGLSPGRIERVTGFADRKPAADNREAARNNRVEMILLRSRR